MSGRHGRAKAPWLELVIAVGGAFTLALMAGYLLRDAFDGSADRPPDIVLERGEPVAQSTGWHVPFRVRNLGDRPAEAVELRAELKLAGGSREEAALTLDFLPPRGTVEGAFLFTRDPDGKTLRVWSAGYLVP